MDPSSYQTICFYMNSTKFYVSCLGAVGASALDLAMKSQGVLYLVQTTSRQRFGVVQYVLGDSLKETNEKRPAFCRHVILQQLSDRFFFYINSTTFYVLPWYSWSQFTSSCHEVLYLVQTKLMKGIEVVQYASWWQSERNKREVTHILSTLPARYSTNPTNHCGYSIDYGCFSTYTLHIFCFVADCFAFP